MSQPVVEAVEVAAVHEAEKALCQAARLIDDRPDAAQRLDKVFLVAALGLVGLALLPAKHPGTGTARRGRCHRACGSRNRVEPLGIRSGGAKLREGIAHGCCSRR